MHGSDVGERWLRLEESLACSAGILIVTLGDGAVTALTLVWLVSAAVGVVARGGRVGTAGRVLVVSVLASPIAALRRSPSTASACSPPAAGCCSRSAASRRRRRRLLRDPLTGTLSRAAFDAQCERLVAHAVHADPHRPMGIVLLDLDDLGAVNKQRGHRVGDMVLVTAAAGDLPRPCATTTSSAASAATSSRSW